MVRRAELTQHHASDYDRLAVYFIPRDFRRRPNVAARCWWLMKVQFPEKALPLFTPAPYKVMRGGRGGSKSWDMARAIIALGANRKLFIVCGREIQRSIKDSVHKLL